MTSTLRQIPRPVWIIGMVTLLINLSSIMVFSLSPIYVTQVFGLAVFHLGLLEGCLEFFSWFVRIFSGALSDYFRKRKPLLIAAYIMTFISRPIFALAPSLVWIYAAKITDRISNGIQASPREALVADVAPEKIKGACYGLRQSLGLIGSLLGASIVVWLMQYTDNNFQYIFLFASIPPFLALLSIIFFVKDVLPSNDGCELDTNKVKKHGKLFQNVSTLNPEFWKILIVGGIFMLSNYSSAYRILQAERIGFPFAYISLVMIVQNLGAMLAAFPVAKLSDTIDRRILLGIGFFITILSNSFFGFINGIYGVLIGSTLWGIQMGITQSILLTMIADTSNETNRATAFGIYYLVVAFSLFISNMVIGWVFDSSAPTMAFVISALLAAAGLLLLVLLTSNKKNQLAKSNSI